MTKSVWLAVVAVAAACGGDKASEPAPAGERSAAATDRSPPRAVSAREAWRIDVQGAPSAAGMAPAGDDVVIAWNTDAVVVFPGHAAVEPTGEGGDAMLTRVGADGAVAAVRAIRGGGQEEIEALIPGETLAVVLSGDRPMTIAGTRLAARAVGADELLPPRWGALVTIGPDLSPTAALPLPEADSWTVMPAGDDWIVSTNTDRETRSAKVQRLSRTGKPTWTLRLDGLVNVMADLGGGVALALTRGEKLGVVRFDPATGKVVASDTLDRVDSFAGDLGALAGVAPAGDAHVVYGHSGREAVGGMSHAVEPLVLLLRRGEKPVRSQLLDATGDVVAAGTLRGEPAAVVNVIHNDVFYGGLGVPHRGTYVVLGGHAGAPALAPLLQVRFANDDWENQPPELVTGSVEMSTTRAVLGGDRVWRAGRCGADPGDRACVALAVLSAP